MQNALDILLQYDVIFSDIYGVIHNGSNLLPNVATIYKTLINEGKTVTLISNAPRPTSFTLNTLNKLGFTDFQHIITSGEMFIMTYKNKELDIFNGEAYIIGKEQNPHILEGLNIRETTDISAASFILFLGIYKDLNELEQFRPILSKAAEQGIEAVCPNPDKEVMLADGINFPAGSIAAYYASLGGKVSYFGKPYQTIFQEASQLSAAKNKKCIMLGDSMVTDILGAHNFNIDSMLLLTGITAMHEFNDYEYKPTYIFETL
jgi:HAD superfamily hydrolase (TIGR01459 family)